MDAMNVNHQHYVAFPAMYVQTMANPVVYNNGNGTSTAPQTMYYQPVAVPAEYVQSGFYWTYGATAGIYDFESD